MARRTATVVAGVAMLLAVSSVSSAARKLTTTQMRENTIRINALEIDRIDITEIIAEEKGPDQQIVVMDERSLNFDFDKSNVKPQYFEMLHKFIEYVNFKDYEVVSQKVWPSVSSVVTSPKTSAPSRSTPSIWAP